MKNVIILIGINTLKIVANIIYALIKIIPTKNQIVLISRQSNKITLDFDLLKKEINNREKKIKVVVLCKKLEKGIKNKILYIFYSLKMMYYLVTSRVCVVDSYCIPVSILKHKKNLKIVQIWHSSAAVKRFGYQILDKNEGSNSLIAKIMCMHKNYDYIIAPSEATKKYFAKAFDYDISKIITLGLPRLEYIANIKYDKSAEIYKDYPYLKEKENILYIPTFRKNSSINLIQDILNANINTQKYNLIISLHPLDKTSVPKEYLIDKKYNTFDLIKIADYIITDYSALSVEASILHKPIFLYVQDYEEYTKNRGLNIYLENELETFTSKKISDIIAKIENKDYNMQELIQYQNKYIEVDFNNTIQDMATFLFELYKGNDKKYEKKDKKNSN